MSERPTITDDEGLVWTVYDYGEGDVLYQRGCPDCDGGLLLAPARFHARCGGSGYLVGMPRVAAGGSQQ